MGLLSFFTSRKVHEIGEEQKRPRFREKLQWDEKTGHYKTIKVKIKDEY